MALASASSILRRLPLQARGAAAALSRRPPERRQAAAGGLELRRAMLSTAAAALANPFPSLIISSKGVTARWVCGSGAGGGRKKRVGAG